MNCWICQFQAAETKLFLVTVFFNDLQNLSSLKILRTLVTFYQKPCSLRIEEE